jgi:hypothetical protein
VVLEMWPQLGWLVAEESGHPLEIALHGIQVN